MASRLTAFTNDDKKTHTIGGILPGHPARIGFFAPPSRGKRSAALNLIARADPPFETITIVTHDPKTTEWNLLDDMPEFKVMGYRQDGLPDPASFNRDKKNLVVADELPWDSMGVAERSKLERMFNWGSTHHSITLYVQAQDVFSVPLSVRRALTAICLWSSPLRQSQALYSRMLGIKLQPLFDTLCRSRYDFLYLDFSGDGPPVRKNVFEIIENYERMG